MVVGMLLLMVVAILYSIREVASQGKYSWEAIGVLVLLVGAPIVGAVLATLKNAGVC